MARRKVKLAFIQNDTARKSAYKKRHKGLVKKVDELTTLCGIYACAIIYGPYDHQPKIWPSPSGVEKVLSKFRTMPELEQRKKMMNQESFLKQRISKAEKQLQKQCRDNREKETTMLMYQCLNAGKVVQNDWSVTGLNDLAWMINQNLKEIGRNIHQNQGENQITTAPIQMEPPLLLPLPPPPPPNTSNNEYIARMSHGHLQMSPPLALLPPPPPQQTTSNNDEIAMRAMNNNDIMFTDMMMNGGELETIPFGYDANL